MDPVYLDHAATTPLREEVWEAMRPYQRETFGNASSLHGWGRRARAGLEQARAEVAAALGARPAEIFFVRGGTESDNLALAGTCAAGEGRRRRLVVTAIEHSAVLDAAAHLGRTGAAEVHTLDVTPAGELDLDRLQDIMAGNEATVSVMWVNNETGIVLPIEEVAGAVGGHGALLHTDAAQAVGKVPVDVGEVPVDLLTATGHKINGPKGTGILFVREGTRVHPLLHGGGQERGLRPGTEDVSGAVGFATALRLAVEEQTAHAAHLESLRADFERALASELPGVRINGGDARRSPHVSSIGLPVSDGAGLVMALDLEGVAVSGGSACHSGSGKASHVIAALYGSDDPMATVRFSLGRGTTAEELRRAVAATVQVTGRLAGAA